MHYIKGSFFLLVFSLFTINGFAQTAKAKSDFKWYSWEEMVEAQKVSPKKVMIDMYTDWCGWCKRMDASTFSDPKIQAYLKENFYAVKFDAEQKENITYDGNEFKYIKSGRRGVHELANALLNGKLSYPSIVYLNEDMQRIVISPGFKDAKKFMIELSFTKGEHYKTTNFQQYMKTEMEKSAKTDKSK